MEKHTEIIKSNVKSSMIQLVIDGVKLLLVFWLTNMFFPKIQILLLLFL